MGKAKESPQHEEIDSILQRLKRSVSVRRNSGRQPPNFAQASMGRRLASILLEIQQDKQAFQDIMQVLCSHSTNSSVPHAFFSTLEQQSRSSPDDPFVEILPDSWIAEWIQPAQDAGQSYTLLASLKFCAWQYGHQAVAVDGDKISAVYTKLQPQYKLCWAQYLVCQAPPHRIRPMLSPLIAQAVLNPTIPFAERTLVLNTIMQASWMSISELKGEQAVDLLAWLVDALRLLVDSIDDDDALAISMACNWLEQITEIMSSIEGDLSRVLKVVLQHILPAIQEIAFLGTVVSPLKRLDHTQVKDDKVLLDFMAFVLSVPGDDVFLDLVDRFSKPSSPWIGRLRVAFSVVFAQDENLREIANRLRYVETETCDNSANVVLGIPPGDFPQLLDMLGKALKNMDTSMTSVLTQNALLLLACGLLIQENEIDSVKIFVTNLLQSFPHLGITLLPVIFHTIQEATRDGRQFFARLEFLCSAFVREAHAAQEIWNLVGLTLAKRNQPLSVRLVAIRMHATLCTNHRLYRRVVDSLGNFVEERQLEIRLAVAKAILEMAERDLVRDVADVIGWIQTYLTDEVPSIVHLSLMSLHFMIQNGDLDFDVVMKVLAKRLCAVGDVDKVETLDPIIIEALVVLLGDGEVQAEDGHENEAARSSQVSVAVESLIGLAESSLIRSLKNEVSGRIRFNIYRSLSNYSLDTLGIEEEGIKAIKGDIPRDTLPPESHRYISICKLLREGFIDLQSMNYDNATVDPLNELAMKLVQYEEAVLGSSIWLRGHKSKTTEVSHIENLSSESLRSALPKPQDSHSFYAREPRASSAIGSLLCSDGRDIEHLADIAGDLSNETLSVSWNILMIQGWLQATGRIWSHVESRASPSLAVDINVIIDDIRGWTHTSGSIDYTYLALSCFSLKIPEAYRVSDGSTDQVTLSPLIDTIVDDVISAFRDHRFAQLDIGHLCLALAGLRSLHRGNMENFLWALDTLMDASAGSMSCTGVFFGLAFMAQSIPIKNAGATSFIIADERERQIWVGSIAACLVKELESCFTESNPVVVEFVECLQSTSLIPDLLQELAEITYQTIGKSKGTKARSILMSIGLFAQSIAFINPGFLRGLFYLLRKLPWDSGSEYAMAAILTNSTIAGLIHHGDLEELRDSLLSPPEANMSISHVYLSASLTTSKEGQIRWLDQNRDKFSDSFDENIAMGLIPFVGTIPVLAGGESSFSIPSKVHSHSCAEVISYVLNLVSSNKSGIAPVITGLFASMSLSSTSITNNIVLSSATGSTKTASTTSTVLSTLPTPIEGTFVNQLVLWIRSVLSSIISSESVHDNFLLPRCLHCLEPLSLPGQFAITLLGPFILENDATELKGPALHLLLSQFRGRRRVAVDGREFVNLAVKVVTCQESTLLEGRGLVFYSGLPDLLRKSSTDTIENIVSKSWGNCMYQFLQNRQSSYACKWLEAIRVVLTSMRGSNLSQSAMFSPKVISFVRRFIVEDVFHFVITAPWSLDVDMILDEVSKCFGEIPFSFLDELSFLDGTSGTLELIAKARCIADLIQNRQSEDQDRISKAITVIFAWLSRIYGGDEHMPRVQKVCIVFSSAVAQVSDTTRSQVMLLLLEALLVHGSTSFSLDLLALVSNVWAHSESSILTLSWYSSSELPVLSDGVLSNIYAENLQECPKKLRSLARHLKMERIVCNRLVHIYNKWRKTPGAPKNRVDVLVRILSCCKGKSSLEADLCGIFSSTLTEDQSNNNSA